VINAIELILPSRFPLGRIFVTPGLKALATESQIGEWLTRHRTGDWGVVSDEDRAMLDASVASGCGMLMSAYAIDPTQPCLGYGDNTVWVITHFAVVMLPEEY
jgi:Cft2 family RNA processing exonuclease